MHTAGGPTTSWRRLAAAALLCNIDCIVISAIAVIRCKCGAISAIAVIQCNCGAVDGRVGAGGEAGAR